MLLALLFATDEHFFTFGKLFLVFILLLPAISATSIWVGMNHELIQSLLNQDGPQPPKPTSLRIGTSLISAGVIPAPAHSRAFTGKKRALPEKIIRYIISS